jgi:hypothetical protein
MEQFILIDMILHSFHEQGQQGKILNYNYCSMVAMGVTLNRIKSIILLVQPYKEYN